MNLPSRRTLIAAGAAVLVLLLLGAGGWLWYGAEQRRALEAYALAESRLRTAQATGAKPEARAAAQRDLEAVLARFPSSSAAPQAAYELAGLRYDAGAYAPARAAYEVVLARGGPGTLRTLARAGIGYAWEAERNYAKATEAYRLALQGLGPKDFYYGPLLLDLARGQELSGRKDDAIVTYKMLLENFPQDPRAADVRARLMTLSPG